MRNNEVLKKILIAISSSSIYVVFTCSTQTISFMKAADVIDYVSISIR